MPASNPGTNLVKVPCAPVLALPQIGAMEAPGLAATLYFALLASANTTLLSPCPCTRPTDQTTITATAAPTIQRDGCMSSSFFSRRDSRTKAEALYTANHARDERRQLEG